MSDYDENKWIRHDRDLRDCHIGTKTRAFGGGYWEKNKRGWKWFCGDTFPTPGGDWDGYISLPVQ